MRYKAAIPWSAFINLAEIKWGMDVLANTLLSCPYHSKQDAAQLSNKVISVPSFQQGFGFNFNNTHVVSASLADSFQYCGVNRWILGGGCSEYLADKLGKRKTLGLWRIASSGAVFMQAFARKPQTPKSCFGSWHRCSESARDFNEHRNSAADRP